MKNEVLVNIAKLWRSIAQGGSNKAAIAAVEACAASLEGLTQVFPDEKPTVAIPDDFFSHRQAWRNAIVNHHTTANDDDEVSYWLHELRAFDAAYAKLNETGIAQAEGDVNQKPTADKIMHYHYCVMAGDMTREEMHSRLTELLK